MIDVDALTRPLAQDKPCGDNLEYHADFQALETAARGRPEQQSGGRDGKPVVIPAEAPAWDEVERRALDLLERTRDLRVAVLLTRALTRTNGLAGLAQGLELLDRMVDSAWNDVHPQIDPGDDDDPIMRINALAALVDPGALIRDLRAATFVGDPRQGRCTIRQVEATLGLAERTGDDPVVPRNQLETMLREAAEKGLANEAQRALDMGQGLAGSLATRVGAHRSLDFEPLLRRLRPIAAFYRETVPGAVAEKSPEPAAGPGTHPEPPARAPQALGEIRSRDEAVHLLGKVCEFIERTEPTNPAPLLIRRAQRLMTMNFVDILQDLAPEGVPAISKIAGLPVESK